MDCDYFFNNKGFSHTCLSNDVPGLSLPHTALTLAFEVLLTLWAAPSEAVTSKSRSPRESRSVWLISLLRISLPVAESISSGNDDWVWPLVLLME